MHKLKLVMVLTKAEQAQLTEIKEDYSGLKKLLEDGLTKISSQLGALNDELCSKISAVEETLSNKFLNLQTNLNAEIVNLKEDDAKIRETIDEHKEWSINKVSALANNIGESNDAIDQQSRELEKANKQILSQAAKIVRLEKQCHRGLQHGRGWNVEVDGLPQELGDDPKDLRDAMCNIFELFNIDVGEDEFETIHRLPSRQASKPVIIRFFSRESVREIHQKKSRLKDCERFDELQIPGLNSDSMIFIRASQCAYYGMLAYNCRVLKRKKLISGVNISNDGRVSMKLLDNTIVKVDHESTLVESFPGFGEFSFKYGEKKE